MTQAKSSTPKAPARTPAARRADDGARYDVTVSRAVRDVFDTTFRPGVTYTVSAAVVDALGDAVATNAPHVEPA